MTRLKQACVLKFFIHEGLQIHEQGRIATSKRHLLDNEEGCRRGNLVLGVTGGNIER